MIYFGPTIWVDIGIDSNFNYGLPGIPVSQATQLPALVDTGATHSCIDDTLAQDIGLPVIDRQINYGIGGPIEMSVYFAHIYFPAFGFSQWGRFAGVKLSDGEQPHRALIGRSLLANALMVYDGRRGTVTLAY